MVLLIDYVAKEIALRKSALPECLHVPVAARDEQAISDYVGPIERILAGGSPSRALLVKVAPLALDPCLPISELPASTLLHSPVQVWVHIRYSRYRQAYRRAFPDEDLADKVLSHTLNRRTADLQGFQYVRLTAVSRASNSSSAFSEKWGAAFHSTPRLIAVNKQLGASIRYADLAELMLMLDMTLGGGVMDAVNEGQKLVRPRA